MDRVEASAQSNADSAVTENTQTADVSGDAALEAVWNRNQRDNGAARGDGGKFAASGDVVDKATTDTGEPLEGGEGGEQPEGEISTPSSDVPLPSSWRGKEELWGKIPAELKETLRAHQEELHKTVSTQGQALSSWKPVGETINEFKEYFDGTKGAHTPHEAIRSLFEIQRRMDSNPLDTLLTIADSYDLRPHLQKMFGGATAEGEAGATQQTDNSQALLAEIGQLKQTIQAMNDPSRIDDRINQRLSTEKASNEAQQIISRNQKDMPLYDQIPEDDLVHYISRSWGTLGETASPDAVLKRAYDMAINADPDLRTKAAALKTAAVEDPQRVADAKRANSTNIRSTSTGRPREQTEEEMLAAVFDRHAKG